MRRHLSGPQIVVAGVLFAVLLVAVGVATWAALALAVLPWVMLAVERFGLVLGTALVLLLALLLFELTLMVTAATALPMHESVVALAAVVGATGVVLRLRRPSSTPTAARRALPAVPVLLGSAVWLAVVAAAQVIPGASRLSWVMLGDAANNMLFAREVVYRGGIDLGPTANPVPLPSALLGFVINDGRADVASEDLLRHDVAGFAAMWVLLIALSTVLVGAVVAVVVHRAGASPVIIGAAGALASLLPLSWFVTGYPLEYGFLNAHLAVIVVCAAFLAYLRSAEHPAAALAALAVAAMLLLAIWSPLVLLAGFLGLAVVIRRGRAIVSSGGLDRGLAVAAIVVAIVYVAGFVVPPLISQVGFLSAGGGIIGFPKWFVILAGVAAVGLSLLAFRSLLDEAVLGTVAMVTGSGLGLAALLAISKAWSYYPLKFAWLVSVMLLVMVAAHTAAAVVRLTSRATLRAVLLGLASVAIAGLLSWLSVSSPTYAGVNPLQRIVAGSFLGDGDEVVETLFTLADPAQPRVLWSSGDPHEGIIDFWLLQLQAGLTPENFDLRASAYRFYGPTTIDDLCEVASLTRSGTIVITRDSTLPEQLAEACSGASASLRLEIVP